MNSYVQLKKQQRKELDSFPIKFAFTQESFERGMRELGLEPSDTDKVVAIPGGGFIRETDKQAFLDLYTKVDRERSEAIAADKDGTGFVYDMFRYELANHEYSYTMDDTDTLEALSYTREEVDADPVLSKALAKAKEDFLAEAEEKGWL